VTATISPILRANDGSFRVPGRNQHYREWDFGSATTLPTDLTVTTSGTGAGTFTGADGLGALKLTTDPTANASTTLNLPQVGNGARAYRADFGILAPSTNFPEKLFIATDNGSVGGGWRSDTNLLYGGGESVFLPYLWTYGGWVASHQIGILVIPAQRLVAVVSGDQVLNAAKFSGMVGGIAKPRISALNVAATAHNVSISRASLTVWTD
jgi:hypothetical protein